MTTQELATYVFFAIIMILLPILRLAVRRYSREERDKGR